MPKTVAGNGGQIAIAASLPFEASALQNAFHQMKKKEKKIKNYLASYLRLLLQNAFHQIFLLPSRQSSVGKPTGIILIRAEQ